MAEELHDALKFLSPLDWEDVPKDDLNGYLSKAFTAAELLCNTVPPVPNGTPFDSAQPQFTTPNSAKLAKEVHPSPARPAPPHKGHEDLQKHWGKPMKFSKKENPLEVALYKMAGHDRHGAWYARHQVEEGLGFAKFKKALQREFPETLLTQGEPGAGAKRGLSAERRVERVEVDGIGRIEVYQLSAQMPSPVSPRDFLTLFVTTEQALTEKSAAGLSDGSRHVPRHYMIISRPLEHPDAPQRSSFVRGQYESVEFIREIPLHASAKSKSNLNLTSTSTPGEGDIDPELNPVEWIMITRSDPAGGVPRFLVDRGTPGAMLADVTKFLDWACGQEEIPDPDQDVEKQQQTSEQNAEEVVGENSEQVEGSNQRTVPRSLDKPDQEVAASEAVAQGEESQQTGIVSNLASSLQAGVDTYAPTTVANFVHNQLEPGQPGTEDLSDSSDSSSVDSFMSAEEMKRMSTAPETLPQESTENLSVRSATSSGDLSKMDKKNLSEHDKEVLKIMRQREKLDQKLAKKRAEEEGKLNKFQEKEESEQTKARGKMEKELQKTEERHRKEVEKLEAKREKELKKAEERRKKKDDQNKLSLVARERDEFRSQADLLRKENELLRDQVETLQRENTALAGRVGKLGGADALKSVQDEIAKGSRIRTGTMKSGDSASTKSGGSAEKKDG